MKRFKTYTLNLLKGLVFLFLLGSLTLGCEKENLVPESNSPVVQGSGFAQLIRPDVQCGSSAFSTMQEAGVQLGNVEIVNDADNLYLLVEMNPALFVDQIMVYAGDVASIPLDADGNLLMETFPFRDLVETGSTEYTVILPIASLPTCMEIVVWARVSERDMFGSVIGTHFAWLDGHALAQGFTFSHCSSACVTGPAAAAATL